MRFAFCLLLAGLLPSCLLSQALVTRLDGTQLTTSDLTAQIEQLMKAGRVQGLAVSIFNHNQPVYSRTFGYKRMDTKEPILPSSNFYGASLSKSVFAVLVLKLVEEGVLDLDKPLQSYLPKPIYEYAPATRWHDHYADLKEAPAYAQLTARQCLSHTTGFPNWRWDESDQKLRLHGTPGSRYSYSGEGMVYLQVVLEKMTGRPLESLMQEKVFGPLGMKRSSYTWQPEYAADFVTGHQANDSLYEKDTDNEARSASTLETTLEDYTRFLAGVLQHRVLRPGTTKLMFTPQLRLRSVQQMGPNRFRDTSAYDGIELSAGLGWILLQSPQGTGAFKGGHGNGFQHYSILFPEAGTGVVFLSNSDNAEGIFKALLALTIGDTYTPWYWENHIPFDQRN